MALSAVLIGILCTKMVTDARNCYRAWTNNLGLRPPLPFRAAAGFEYGIALFLTGFFVSYVEVFEFPRQLEGFPIYSDDLVTPHRVAKCVWFPALLLYYYEAALAALNGLSVAINIRHPLGVFEVCARWYLRKGAKRIRVV